MNRRSGLACGLVALLAGGCAFAGFPNFNFGDEEMGMPTVLATYTTGSARLQVQQSSTEGGSGEVVILDRVGRGSTLNNFAGASVTWRNDAGWVLQVTAYEFGSILAPVASPGPSESPGDESYSGDLTLKRVVDNEFWIARSIGAIGNRCIIDITESSATLVQGSATCRGLRWEDGTVPEQFPDPPVYIEGQEPFDVEVTFEAMP